MLGKHNSMRGSPATSHTSPHEINHPLPIGSLGAWIVARIESRVFHSNQPGFPRSGPSLAEVHVTRSSRGAL